MFGRSSSVFPSAFEVELGIEPIEENDDEGTEENEALDVEVDGRVAVPKPDDAAAVDARLRLRDEGTIRRFRMSSRTRRSCFCIDYMIHIARSVSETFMSHCDWITGEQAT